MARIFSVVVSTRVLTLFFCETALIFCCYLAAAYLDSDIEDPAIFLIYDSGLLRITIATAVVVLGFYFRDLYAQLRIRNRLLLTQELAMVFGLAFMVQGAIYYLNRDLIIPRRMMIAGSVLALVGVTALRLLFHFASKSEAIRPGRVLFLGLSPTVVYLAEHLRTHPEFGLEPLGYLDDRLDPPGPHAPPDRLARLGSLEDLYEVLDRDEPNTLVIGRREDIRPSWINEFLELRFGGLRTEEAATLYERTFGRICAAEIRPSRVIFADSLDPAPLDVTLQTVFSILLIAATLPLSLPFALVLAALVKLSSRGPLLEKQLRIGLNDRPFTLYCFRCTDDKGVLTPVGRNLRKSGLDALPQLWNVIRGDMALVGPAPERPEFVQRLADAIPFYRQRHRVKPGLTGWAQVHSEFPDKDVVRELEYDLYYVRHLSPLMNLLVMFLSLKSFFLFRGSIEN
jgi:lipopolysaccharide/colanic/teichoic acid biosynthesis glycosyltransferase